jgi:hypothetical protein
MARKTTKKMPVSRSAFSGKKITKLTKENPRRAGTHGHKSFALLMPGMTYEQVPRRWRAASGPGLVCVIGSSASHKLSQQLGRGGRSDRPALRTSVPLPRSPSDPVSSRLFRLAGPMSSERPSAAGQHA